MCANGSKQRDWLTDEDTSSPTVITESVMMLSVIDAKKRDIATMDIPNAFLQTEQTIEPIHMRIKGRLADLLLEMYPNEYEEYVTYHNEVTTSYVKLLNALYGTLTVA